MPDALPLVQPTLEEATADLSTMLRYAQGALKMTTYCGALKAISHACFAALVGTAREYEVFVAAGFVEVACHDDGTCVGCGFAVDEALGVEGLGSAAAIGDQFGDVAGIGAHEPGELDHFSEGHAAEVQLEA